jgi:hypothetical protein
MAALGIALCELGAGGAAQAQLDGVVPRPFAVKAGLFIPTNAEAREAGGRSMALIEADYTIQNLVESNSLTIISIGVTGRRDLYMIPITLSQVFQDRNNTSGNDYYYGFGLGIYVTKVDLPDTSDQTKNIFGGFLVGGLNLQRNLFVEAKYHYLSRYDRKNINGLQITLGTRF